jgi:hypothetical protein
MWFFHPPFFTPSIVNKILDFSDILIRIYPEIIRTFVLV